MRRLMTAFLLTVAVMVCGCGGQGDPGQARHRVHGEFSLGATTLKYTATYQDTILVAVEEDQHFGDQGQARAIYEVSNGRLVYYRIDEQRRVVADGDNARFEDVCLEFEFDASGRIKHQTKLVDGEPFELVGYEVPGVQRHFEELKRRADQMQGAAVGGM